MGGYGSTVHFAICLITNFCQKSIDLEYLPDDETDVSLYPDGRSGNMNAIELSLFASRITAVCDEMGAVLRRAAFSTNIKDRLDFSCAVFDPKGHLCAQAAHIPVHLGSMAYAMHDLVDRHGTGRRVTC